MSLYTDVIARIPDQTLKELTNPRDNSATATDTALLTLVCQDVQAELEVELGVVYGAASLPERDRNFQITKGVEGVRIKLESYTATDSTRAQARYDRWVDSLLRRRKRGVAIPGSNAKGEVRDDQATDRLIFDRQQQQKGWLPTDGGVNREGTTPPVQDE